MASNDRDVLLVLYRSTGGDAWHRKGNWNTQVNLVQWYGVEANDQGRVVRLDLSDNNLQGSIPPELGNLSALKELYLVKNRLSGTMPRELGKLKALSTMELNHNSLTGPIPKDLGALTELKHLLLFTNDLTGRVPRELGELSNLETLLLYGNKLTGTIPRGLGSLSKLRELKLDYNQLTGHIPKELGNLSHLTALGLSENQLTGTVPRELGNLSGLEQLGLHDNQLSALWSTLEQGEAGSMTTPQGNLPEALAALLDMLDRTGIFLGLDQNPWEDPPEAIIAGGMRMVRDYFEAIYRGGTITVTRPLKVVVIGKETVGKTSLRHSIKTGKPCRTKEGEAKSTVHVDVEDHEIDGHPIRIFDCAGQVVYYGLLQLFLTPRAVYLLLFDAEVASKMTWDTENAASNLETLGIAPWLRHLTFRVPDANVVLVGNKCDLVSSKHNVAPEVERQSRRWLASWIEKARSHRSRGLLLEDGVSLVSCASPVKAGWAPAFGRRVGWPCDKSEPGLFRRICHDPAGNPRALRMFLPPSYRLALGLLETLASSSRGGVAQGITRASLEEKWEAKVGELEEAGTTVAAPKAAMSGAILIRKWEGGLVQYGNFIFLDVQWFSTVLDPLFSHKRDSFGNLDLGGRRVTSARSLDRLEDDHVLEPQLAEELWGAVLTPHLLLALKSAGLTFPLPNDPRGGLVILLRMDTSRPDDYHTKLDGQLTRADQGRRHDLRLHAECSFSLGLPPGFVERLLARCCYLGFPYPVWRYGALIVGEGGEEGLFSLSLEYSEKTKTLTMEGYGGCREVYVWAALSKAISVTIKMLAEFRGLPCEPAFFCPLHKDRGMPIRTTDARPGSPLVESGFCLLCTEQKAGKGLLAAALRIVKFSDEEFFDAQLCQQFAENAENVALWPGSNSEDGSVGGMSAARSFDLGLRRRTPLNSLPPAGPDPIVPADSSEGSSSQQGSQPPWFSALINWQGATGMAFITIFTVFGGREDDDPRLWGLFLGIGMLLLGWQLVMIAQEHRLLCFTTTRRRVEGGSAIGERGDAGEQIALV